MEITIFKKNEIKQTFFENLFLYLVDSLDICDSTSYNKLIRPEYGDFKSINDTKRKIDSLSVVQERYRNNIVKYLHDYELLEVLCIKKVISRSYFKLYEMIYHNPIILSDRLDCFFICEAPGGFIDCINDIRRKKNKHFDYLTTSINERNGIFYNPYVLSENIMYHDITTLKNIELITKITLNKFPDGVDLVTGDGGFDVKYFHAQEVISSKLLLSEIVLALSIQKIGGTFVLKVFDMFTHNTNIFYLLLCSCYSHVKIIKPRASRYSNSERYFVCHCFIGTNESLLVKLKRLISIFQQTNNTNEHVIIFPDFSFGKNNNLKEYYVSKISLFNNTFVKFQIKTIRDSIDIITKENCYFQNLLINVFENKGFLNYKNILREKINKCIMFLKEYNINTHYYKLSGNRSWNT